MLTWLSAHLGAAASYSNLKISCVKMDLKQLPLPNTIILPLARLLLLLFLYAAPNYARADKIVVPLFWNLQHQVEKPNYSALKVVRLVTDDTYPPFGFTMSDGQVAGFNVDLARALCDELQLTCTIQVRRWDQLIPALEQGQADAIIASLAMTPANRKRVDFTAPYYKTPARFIVRANSPLNDITPPLISGQMVGVVRHSAHEAYLSHYFPASPLRSYDTLASLYAGLKMGDVDVIFGDGISASLWLAGADAHDCCRFASGPYLERTYFGEGAGIAVKKGNVTLRRALDYALAHSAAKGTYKELYLRYFPISFF